MLIQVSLLMSYVVCVSRWYVMWKLEVGNCVGIQYQKKKLFIQREAGQEASARWSIASRSGIKASPLRSICVGSDSHT